MPVSLPFSAANALFVEERYSEALSLYSTALDSGIFSSNEDKDVSPALLHRNRALCHLKLASLPAAKSDLHKALELLEKEKKSEEDIEVDSIFIKRKLGETLFHLGDFFAAKTLFVQTGAKLWQRKAEAELAGSALPLSEFMKSAGVSLTSSAFSKPTEPVKKTEVEDSEEAILVEELLEENPVLKPIDFDWSQGDEFVQVDVKLKKGSPEFIKVDLESSEEGAFLKVVNNRVDGDAHFQKYEKGMERELLIKPLFGKFLKEESNVNFTPYKIEIRLKKEIPNKTWESLRKEEKQINAKPAAYPTSRKEKKDWTSVSNPKDFPLQYIY